MFKPQTYFEHQKVAFQHLPREISSPQHTNCNQIKFKTFYILFEILKGAGNDEYRDIENEEIKKTGTTKMKQQEYREKNNGNIEIKIENGEIKNVVRNPFLNNTSIPVC